MASARAGHAEQRPGANHGFRQGIQPVPVLLNLAILDGARAVAFHEVGGAIWDGQMVFNITPTVLLALLYQGLVTAAFGFVAWNQLLQR